MPVIALVELLLDDIAYEQNFSAAENIGDNELRDARHEHHSDAAYNAGHGERKDYLRKVLAGVAPRSPAASRRLRSIFIRAL